MEHVDNIQVDSAPPTIPVDPVSGKTSLKRLHTMSVSILTPTQT